MYSLRRRLAVGFLELLSLLGVSGPVNKSARGKYGEVIESLPYDVLG